MVINKLRNLAYRGYKKLETREHRLEYLFFEVTRRCNLSCLHCGSDCSRELTMKEMTLETWISLMDYVKIKYDPFIVITGGEPLVREDLGEFTAELKKRKLRWGMVTNGMALDQKTFDLLRDNGLSSMTISLDGSRAHHTHIRRHPQSYNNAIKALRILGSSNLEYKDAVTCVYPGNWGSLEEVAQVLLDLGITSWRLFRIFPKGNAQRHPELFLTFEQSQELIHWIARNRSRYKNQGLDLSFSCEGYLPFPLDRKLRSEPYFCRAGINIASILCDGTITGCNNNGPQFYQGNLKDVDFHQVWENKFLEYRDRTWMKTGPCADCKHWKDCLGSSIHLKDKDLEGPGFCYLKDVSGPA